MLAQASQPIERVADARWSWRSVAALGVCLALLAACAEQGFESEAEDSGRPPDVVLFVVDTLRADWLGAYEPGRETSPTIDALAREGVVFEQASAAAPWTLPSVVSILTSTFVGEHQISHDGQKLAEGIPTLPELLRELHYLSLSFHRNPYAGRMSGLDRGFDRSVLVPREIDGARLRGPLQRLPDRPLFLYVHNTQPHDPHLAPRPFIPRFGAVPEEAIGEIARVGDEYRKLTRVDFVERQPLGTTDNTPEQQAAIERLDALRAEYEVLYSASVLEADRLVAEIVAELRAAGRFENAYFILVADHGEELGEHGGWQHDQSLYEELVRVPLIVRFPGAEHAGTRIWTPVSLVDVLPTVLDVLGRPELAAGARGRSLLPLIEGRAGEPGPRVTAVRWNRKKHYRPFAEQRGERNVAVREGSWKGIWNADHDTLELYDLAQDPNELRNLAANEPERARRFADLAREDWAEQERNRRGAAPGQLETPDEDARRALQDLGYVDADED